jgi:hypothetical protein
VNAASEQTLDDVRSRILNAYRIESAPPSASPLIFAVVTKDGVQRK